MKLPKEAEDILKELQGVQQQLQTLMYQKQNVSVQKAEISNALTEIEKSKENEMFQIIGTIMIRKDREKLLSDLKEKKDILDLRIKSLDKQIDKLSERNKELQNKLIKITQ